MSEVLVRRELPSGLVVTSGAPLLLTLIALIPGIRGIWIAFNAPFLYATGVAYYGFIGYSWIFVAVASVFFTLLVYVTAKYGLVYLPRESGTRNHFSLAISLILTVASLGFVAAAWDLCNDVRDLGISSGLLGFGILLYGLTCIALIMHILMLIGNYGRFTKKTE